MSACTSKAVNKLLVAQVMGLQPAKHLLGGGTGPERPRAAKLFSSPGHLPPPPSRVSPAGRGCGAGCRARNKLWAGASWGGPTSAASSRARARGGEASSWGRCCPPPALTSFLLLLFCVAVALLAPAKPPARPPEARPPPGRRRQRGGSGGSPPRTLPFFFCTCGEWLVVEQLPGGAAECERAGRRHSGASAPPLRRPVPS